MPDVVERIEHDHREVEQLFAEFQQTRDQATAAQICDELDKHTKAEDQAVYPVFAEELSNEQGKVREELEANAGNFVLAKSALRGRSKKY